MEVVRARRSVFNTNAQIRALETEREKVHQDLVDARHELGGTSFLSIRDVDQLALVGRTDFRGEIFPHPSIPQQVINDFRAAHPDVAILDQH